MITFAVSATVNTAEGVVNCTPDGQAITHIDTVPTFNLCSQPLNGGPAKQLTTFKDNGVVWSAWSRDGKQIAITRGTVTRDVVLLSDFK